MKKIISMVLAISLLCTVGAASAEGQTAGGGAGEHMTSFDYAYKLEAVRDWLLQQAK